MVHHTRPKNKEEPHQSPLARGNKFFLLEKFFSYYYQGTLKERNIASDL
jgi:hypothetical protein